MPVSNRNDIRSFDDLDGVEIIIPDARHADEVPVAIVLAIGGRPLHRVAKPA